MSRRLIGWAVELLCVLLLMAALSSGAWAAPPINVDSEGLAIKGYDPVAYFTLGKAVPGIGEFVHEWQGAHWRFSSQEHLDLFRGDPEKYAPQYGGYWAFAVGNGSIAPIDPEAWSVVDDKLYLNLDRQIQQKWTQDIPGYIERGNRNWPGVLEK